MFDPQFIFVAAVLGALMGVVMSLTGAGGGILAVPLLVFVLHLPLSQAAPISLLAVFLGASLSAMLGLKQGIVRYRAAMVMGGVGVLVAPWAVVYGHHISNEWLTWAFAGVLVWSSLRTLVMQGRGALHEVHRAPPPCELNSSTGRFIWTRSCAMFMGVTGAMAGALSGLLGVGGGFVIVPTLRKYTPLDTRSIQATSLAVIALVSMSGATASVLSGRMSWGIAAPFAVGTLAALLWVRQYAKNLSERMLQVAFAWIALLASALMLAKLY